MKEKIRLWQKGSFTVELTILFTFILFVLFAFVFGIMCAYQNMFLQKAVNSAVLEATETQDFSGVISDSATELESKIKLALKQEMVQSIFGQDNFKVFIEPVENKKIVSVKVRQEIDVPLGGIKQFFSGSDKLVFTVGTKAVTDSTVSVMRDTDFAVEIALRITESIKENFGLDILNGALSKIKWN